MTPSSNVDPVELIKFSELAHRWWDTKSEFKPLHQINPLRLNWIDSIASLKGARVVDVGCGGGILSEAMANRGAKVTGIDLAERSLKVARLHALETKTENLIYREVSAEVHGKSEPSAADIVTCMEMLEHVPDPASIVRACAQMVKPEGWCFFSTINRNPMAFAQAILGAEYVLGLIPKGTHEFSRFIRPSELIRFCRTANLVHSQTTGLAHNPLNGRYWLGSGTSVNYMIAAQKMS